MPTGQDVDDSSLISSATLVCLLRSFVRPVAGWIVPVSVRDIERGTVRRSARSPVRAPRPQRFR